MFKWKGFILDALTFYKANVSVPLALAAAKIIGSPLPAHFIDGAVLLGLFIGALLRALLLRPVPLRKRVAEVVAFGTSYLAMLFIMAKEPQIPGATTVWVLYPAFVLVGYLSTRGAERLLAMAYMLVPVLLICILAAVSSGLAR